MRGGRERFSCPLARLSSHLVCEGTKGTRSEGTPKPQLINPKQKEPQLPGHLRNGLMVGKKGEHKGLRVTFFFFNFLLKKHFLFLLKCLFLYIWMTYLSTDWSWPLWEEQRWRQESPLVTPPLTSHLKRAPYSKHVTSRPFRPRLSLGPAP